MRAGAPKAAAAPPLVAPRFARSTVAFACMAMLVSYLPFSAVNGILGTIGSATGAHEAQLQWVSDAFALTLAGTVLSAGVLSDLYGRRRVAIVGLSLTVLGGMLGFAAGWLHGGPSILMLTAAEGVAGLGGGAVMSSTLGLIAAGAADISARNRAIAAWAAAVVGGLGSGPFLAGVVTAVASWNWLFVPICFIALAVLWFGVARAQESASPAGRRLDWPGQLTGAIAIAALIGGIIQGGASGWGSPIAVGALSLAAVALVGFIVVEQRSASPLLREELFESGGFTAASVAAMAVLFSLVGIVFVLSLFFAHQDVSNMGIAVRLGCLFGANAVASLAAAALQTALGPRIVLIAGLLITAAGMVALLSISDTSGLGGVALQLVVAGVGSGLVMATTSSVAVHSVSIELAGMAGAANNAIRQVGSALGTAALGVVLTTRLHEGVSFAGAVHSCIDAVVGLLVAAALAAAVLLFGHRFTLRGWRTVKKIA